MNEDIQDGSATAAAEQALRERLAIGDMAIATTRPILRHLLANQDHTLFSDEVIARVGGMIRHVARQLLFARAEAGGVTDLDDYIGSNRDELTCLLMEDAALLAHAHSLTLEVQAAEQAQRRCAIDCVLSPLLQEQTSSDNAQVAGAAMRVMAAQARFIQHQRRMELPLEELPGDLFHKSLLLMRTQAGDDAAAETAEAKLRSEYDEGNGRIGQITRLVMGMRRKAIRSLSIEYAGLAIFVTALAMATEQDRNLAILSLGENQVARLALALRAAGLDQSSAEEQFLYIHPDVVFPEGLAALDSRQANSLLAESQPEAMS